MELEVIKNGTMFGVTDKWMLDVVNKVMNYGQEPKQGIEKRKEQEGVTKFSQYQLEGDKSNYKEVLVTMPKHPYHTLAYQTRPYPSLRDQSILT